MSDVEAALAAHKHALAACRRCPLGPGVVPVISDAAAPRVLLVGQAPGQSEVASRRAFIGRAGRTLFRWLERAGLDEPAARAAIHFAAVTRCYPGPHPAGRGDRVPSPAERARCAPWLDAELEILRPALVLPVGRLAIDRLIGPVALADVVGRRVPVALRGGPAVAVPLPHPSGASSWLNVAAHQALLDQAVGLVGDELRRLGVVGAAGETPGRRSAA